MQRPIVVDGEAFTREEAEKRLKYVINRLEDSNLSSEKFDHLKKKAEKLEEKLGK